MLNLLKLIFLMLGLQKLIWVEIGTSFLIINFLKYPANCQCCQDKEMICRVPFQFTRWQDSVSNRAYLHCVSCDCCYTNNVEFCKSHTLKFCGRFAEYGNKEGNWLHLFISISLQSITTALAICCMPISTQINFCLITKNPELNAQLSEKQMVLEVLLTWQ